MKVTRWTPQVIDDLGVHEFWQWLETFEELNRLQQEAAHSDREKY